VNPSIKAYAVEVPEIPCPVCFTMWTEDCGQAVAVRKFGKCIVCLVRANERFELKDVHSEVVRCYSCRRDEKVCGRLGLSKCESMTYQLVCTQCQSIMILEDMRGGQ
jgi:hypothetical protein